MAAKDPAVALGWIGGLSEGAPGLRMFPLGVWWSEWGPGASFKWVERSEGRGAVPFRDVREGASPAGLVAPFCDLFLAPGPCGVKGDLVREKVLPAPRAADVGAESEPAPPGAILWLAGVSAWCSRLRLGEKDRCAVCLPGGEVEPPVSRSGEGDEERRWPDSWERAPADWIGAIL